MFISTIYNMRKGTFENSSGFTQLCILMMFIFCGSIFGIIPISLLEILNNGTRSASDIRVTILIQDLFIFILPPLATQFFIWKTPISKTLQLNKPMLSTIMWGILAIVSIGPFIDFVSTWNQGLHLPQSMQLIEQWMIDSEKEAEVILNSILNTTTWGGYVSNILIISIMAGIGEELLFRGVLQKIFIGWTRNAHIGILLTAAIFSAIHFQFFGFFPRLILGSILGYIYLYSRSLWVPIIIHAINNAMTVAFTPTTFNSENQFIESIYETENNYWFAIIGLAIFALSIWRMRKQYLIKH